MIRGNTIENNSRGEPGKHPDIAIYPRAVDVRGYLIHRQHGPRHAGDADAERGIKEKNGTHDGNNNYADKNTIIGNAFGGRKTADVVLASCSETVCKEEGAVVVRLGQ